MTKSAEIIFKEDTFCLSGHLNFSNVMPIYIKSLLQFKQCDAIHFDFSKLKSSDSAGLALLIEWKKFSEKNQKKIYFDNLPQDLISIIKAARLDVLF